MESSTPPADPAWAMSQEKVELIYARRGQPEGPRFTPLAPFAPVNRRRPYFFLPQMWIVRPPPGGVFQEPTRLLPNLKVRPVLVRLPILLKMPITAPSESDSRQPYPGSRLPHASSFSSFSWYFSARRFSSVSKACFRVI